jgi:hypothetical protein
MADSHTQETKHPENDGGTPSGVSNWVNDLRGGWRRSKPAAFRSSG